MGVVYMPPIMCALGAIHFIGKRYSHRVSVDPCRHGNRDTVLSTGVSGRNRHDVDMVTVTWSKDVGDCACRFFAS